jgi:putative ABC transport system permease protein
VLSAVVAALLPAMRLGRLDIIGVMRGQSVSPRLNKVVPLLGLGLAVVGGLVVVSSARAMVGGEVRIALGAIALVLGVLCIIPALLVMAGRLAAVLPAAPRMALRDAARHRSRSTPTVAAILAAVTALTTFSIGLASDTEQRLHEYAPRALPGEGTIYTGDAETKLSVEAALKGFGGTVRTIPLLVVRGAEDPLGPQPGTAASPQPFVTAVPTGCTVEQSIVQSGPEDRCIQLGTMAYDNGFIGVLPAGEIASRLHLTDTQRRAVEDGGIAVAVPAVASQAMVTLVSGTFVMDQSTFTATDVRTNRTDRLPVVAVPAASRTNGAMPVQTGAFVTPQTVARLGWPATQMMVLVRDTEGGPIDRATEKRLDELVGDEGGFYVERGFQRQDETVMRIMMAAGAFLVLVVTLISTALAMAEQQRDQGTFAAVGATRRTRRALAASQATVVGLLGALLGVAVGLVPGIAVTYPLTGNGSGMSSNGTTPPAGPYLEIPWQPLLLVVVGVPLLAGLLSALAVRRAPAVTRRGA